jgi:hypothetical protein
VTDELRRIDKHFGLLPAALGGPRFGPRDNYGIKRVERLNGNVGYLRLDTFVPDTATAAPLLRSALALLSRTDALIIDLRTNPGGAAELNQLLISYLVPQRSLPLSTFVIRQGARSDSAIRMTASVIDERLAYVDRPVYILVSPHTASSAEWFHVQSAGAQARHRCRGNDRRCGTSHKHVSPESNIRRVHSGGTCNKSGDAHRFRRNGCEAGHRVAGVASFRRCISARLARHSSTLPMRRPVWRYSERWRRWTLRAGRRAETNPWTS